VAEPDEYHGRSVWRRSDRRARLITRNIESRISSGFVDDQALQSPEIRGGSGG
jgi:hypothetical protein